MTTPLTIYIMQSAHTDIGFTHPQEQIMWMYLDYYDRVLELCRQTAHQPETHRFKWTCETFWQVRHYLAARPDRLAEFVGYVRSGQIEITAAYLHFTDMIDVDAYRRSLQWAVDFCHEHNLPLRCLMHCDINGWPWGVADIMAENEIPYFYSSVHTDSATEPLGERGTGLYFWTLDFGAKYLSKFVKHPLRPDLPIRIPKAFWWQGPKGGQVLHWLGELYILGNFLGLSSPHAFHADKTRHFIEADHTSVDEMYALAQETLPLYIERLRAGGYRRDALLIQTAGFNVDNSAPDLRWCDLIQRWNANHDWIKLRTATISEWFDKVESWGTDTLPTYATAWPDHWSHGLGSATARIAQARRTQRRRAAITSLVEASHSLEAKKFLEHSFEQELFSLEHTFNAWSTTAHPQSQMNDFIQATKELTFHRAELYLNEAADTALRSIQPPSADAPRLYVPTIAVSQLVQFNAGDLVISPESHALLDTQGRPYPFQANSSSDFVAVLPNTDDKLSSFTLTATPSPIKRQPKAPTRIETDTWHIEVDPMTGGLRELHDAISDYNWVDTDHEYGFGQLVQESVIHPFGREAVGNLARYLALDMASDSARDTYPDLPAISRTCLTIEGQPAYISGPVFDAIELSGEQESVGQVRLTWRSYHTLPMVELVIDWHKRWNNLSEAAYVAFPFRAKQLEVENSGGFFKPGSHTASGQLPGTCATYYTVQNAAYIAANQNHLIWQPLDAPLVMTNELNFSRWETTEPYDWNGFIASMPVNHYWHTNFATSQRGFLRLRYRFVNHYTVPDLQDVIPMVQAVDAFGWR